MKIARLIVGIVQVAMGAVGVFFAILASMLTTGQTVSLLPVLMLFLPAAVVLAAGITTIVKRNSEGAGGQDRWMAIELLLLALTRAIGTSVYGYVILGVSFVINLIFFIIYAFKVRGEAKRAKSGQAK